MLEDELFYNVENQRVLVRVDFNVPMHNGVILDATKIMRTLPTIEKLLQQKAKITLITHLGRPDNNKQMQYALEPIAQYLTQVLQQTVKLIHSTAEQGQAVTLLENLRFFSGEITNDIKFAKWLMNFGDILIMENFASAHRYHASTYGIMRFAAQVGIGPLFAEELHALNKIKQNTIGLVLILGGNKINTKLSVLKKLITQAMAIILGGSIANTFLQVLGYNVGKSLVEESVSAEVLEILDLARRVGCKICLPQDVLVATSMVQDQAIIKNIAQIRDEDYIVDVGPHSINEYINVLQTAKLIFFNGPFGMYENVNFRQGTNVLLQAISEAQAYSVIGGASTNMVANQQQFIHKIDYISTGGGAFLEYMATGNLAKLMAIAASKQHVC